eukprot:111885-Rhodomonas_salina.1
MKTPRAHPPVWGPRSARENYASLRFFANFGPVSITHRYPGTSGTRFWVLGYAYPRLPILGPRVPGVRVPGYPGDPGVGIPTRVPR